MNPPAKAPQTILIAVSPEVSGKWDWDNIVDTLNETLDTSKKRAVEPDHLEKTNLSHLILATMTWNTSDVRKINMDPAANLVDARSTQKPLVGLPDLVPRFGIDFSSAQVNFKILYKTKKGTHF